MAASILVLSAIAVIVLICIIRWFLNLRKIHLDLSLLPGYKGSPILGDLHFLFGRSLPDGIPFHSMILQSMMAFSALYRKEGLCKMWIMHEPHVLLYSAETTEPIFSSNSIIEKSQDYNLLHCWLGTGLLTSNGNKWRKRRKLITPTFHYRILDDFIPIFNNHSKTFVEQLEKYVQKEWINIVPLITRFTLDIICETAMGIKLGAQEEKSCEYATAIACFGDIFVKRSVRPWLENDTLFFLTPDGRRLKKALNILHEFTSQVVKRRKEEFLNDKIMRTSDKQLNNDEFGRKEKHAFLDMLLQAQISDNCMSDEDICEEVDTFMFEGHDTTAMGISWALYHLGRHPKVQEKIYEELQQVFGNDKTREITSMDLKEMKYLECVIKECQRLSPSVPIITRRASEDVKIKGYKVPADTILVLFIYGLHRDPEVFPNPEKFDPNRFLPDNCLERHPFAFVPFSAGPRNCIGQKFAMNEMKISLCNVMRNFIVESLDPIDKIMSSAMMVLRSVNGIRIKLIRRT